MWTRLFAGGAASSVLNKARPRKLQEQKYHRPVYTQPMGFRLGWSLMGKGLTGQPTITQGPGGNDLFIQQEQLLQRRQDRTERWTRNDRGEGHFQGERPGQ